MSRTPKRILDKIREAKEKQSKRLDLSGEYLGEIPPEVFELEWLEELCLLGLGIEFIRKDIQKLSNLTYLNLSSSEDITQIDRELEKLTEYTISGPKVNWHAVDRMNMENFRISNFVKYIPDSIANLKKLKILNLSDNELTSIPPCIYELDSLEILILGNRSGTSWNSRRKKKWK